MTTLALAPVSCFGHRKGSIERTVARLERGMRGSVIVAASSCRVRLIPGHVACRGKV